MTRLTAKEAYFIKLGPGGAWEDECLRDGIIHFGYSQTPHHLCTAGNWPAVQETWVVLRNGDRGTAARDVNQIRIFYEADEETIFITFSGGLMYWCRPSGDVQVFEDGDRWRSTVDGWHSSSLNGLPLTRDRISGGLQKVEMFRGTICKVKLLDYLLRKIGDELSPELAQADAAEHSMVCAIKSLMSLLTWQDFELLVDLVFSSSGWRRINVVGRTQKTVDLELILPTTEERAFVQVKSEATANSLHEYVREFGKSGAYTRMFFVWHSGDTPSSTEDGVTLLGPDRLAKMVLDTGLWSWLRNKAS